MYKKTILASAIAGIVSSHGYAASAWDTGAQVAVIHGDLELTGTSEVTGVAQSNALLRLGAEYAVNDTITFTYDIAKATNASWPNSIISYATSNAESIASVADDTAKVTTTAANTLVLSSTKANSAAAVGDLIEVDSQTFRIIAEPTTTSVKLDRSFTGSAANNTAAFTYLNPKVVTLGLQSSTDTSATYRVASFSGTGTSTVGATLQVPAPNISPAGLVAADQMVAFSSSITDTLATKAKLADQVTELAFTTVTAFDGVVDVEDGRNTFTASTTTSQGAASDKADKWEYTMTQTSGTDGVSVTGTATSAVTHLDVVATKTVLELPGDFTYLDSNTTSTGIQLTAAGNVIHTSNNAGAQVGTNAFTTAGNLTITGTSGGTNMAISANKNTLDITSAVANAVLPNQTWSPTITTTYTTDEGIATNTSVLSPTAAAGSWTLNGANITIYGVPYGDTVSRFLWVNNKGATAGAVEATVVSGGTSYGPYTLTSTAAANASSEVGNAIDAALTGAGVTLPASSRANVTLTVPVKAADVTVSAAYKHIADADRLTLETSDTIQDTVTVSGTIATASDCTMASTNSSITGKATATNSKLAMAITNLDCTAGGGSVSTTTVSK